MRIKKKIIDNWSLDAKDNYDLLREKVSFSDTTLHKKNLIFKSLTCTFASVIIVFLGLFIVLDNFPIKDPNYLFGSDSANTDKDATGNVEGDGSVSGDEGETAESDKFLEFINYLTQNIIYTPSVENIDIFKNEPSYMPGYSKPDSMTNYVEKIINYFNGLEYKEVNIDSLVFDYQMIFNNDWLTIHYGNHNYVVFAYSDKYLTYETNAQNIEKDINQIINSEK